MGSVGATIRDLRRARGWTQLQLAEEFNKVSKGDYVISADEVKRWERGRRTPRPEGRRYLAKALGIPEAVLLSIPRSPSATEPESIDDVNRRELLRLMSTFGVVLASSGLDIERWGDPTRRLDANTVDQYEAMNTALWSTYAACESKASMMPMVREHLAALSAGLRHSGDTLRPRMCALTSDTLQLAGEVFLDGSHHADAAHAYTLAATASREAKHYDLWACAMTRHAFIAIYEKQHAEAAGMLETAFTLARRGDGELSTRYWVKSVQAQALAGAGAADDCQRALDTAQDVQGLTGVVHNAGWLRFDGTRLAEEAGSCYVALGKPALAEPVLQDALQQELSPRRRGTVLTDLALAGAQLGDLDRLVAYGGAAADTARRTGSGVLSHGLQALQPRLALFPGDARARSLSAQINALTTTRKPETA